MLVPKKVSANLHSNESNRIPMKKKENNQNQKQIKWNILHNDSLFSISLTSQKTVKINYEKRKRDIKKLRTSSINSDMTHLISKPDSIIICLKKFCVYIFYL